jgi:tetratricopeptide (TPR) repeat protein
MLYLELKDLLDGNEAPKAPITAAKAAATPPAPSAVAAPAKSEATAAKPKPQEVASAGSSDKKGGKKTEKKAEKKVEKKVEKKGGKKETNPALMKTVLDWMVTGEQYRQKKQLRNACSVWEQILGVQPGTTVACHCYEQIGLVSLGNQQWASARTHFDGALREAEILDDTEAIVYSLVCQAKARLGPGRHLRESAKYGDGKGGKGSAGHEEHAEEAMAILQRAARMCAGSKYGTLKPTTSLAALLRAGGVQFKGDDAKAPRVHAFDVQALLANACVLAGEVDKAITLCTSVLQHDETHKPTLLQYGELADMRGKHAEALTIVLRVLVQNSEDREVKALFTDMLSRDGGIATLNKELKLGTEAAPAYAFLATVVRDFGALKESAALYESAVQACPENHNYCLNYVHVLENLAAYQKAFDVLVGYFEQHSDFQCVGGGLTCSMLLDTLKESGIVKAGLKKYASSPQPPAYELEYVERDLAAGQSGSAAHVKINLGGGETVLSKGGEKTETFIRAIAIEGETEEEIEDILSAEDQKSTEDHDMLALFFTLVKVLYSSGCLGVLPSLIRLIEPARRGRDLGQTLVRNEHAYYVCIAQLLCLHPDKTTFSDVSALQTGAASSSSMTCSASASAAAANVPDSLYVCGDSHSLCPSWRTLTIHGKKVLLHSALVTGLKHWHVL